MPIYDFKCEKGHKFEAMVPVELKQIKCEKCGEPAERAVVHRVSAVFKGSGTSKTDNAPIDLKVGRDANKNWERYHNKFKKKESIMQKNPDSTIYSDGEGYVAVNKDGSTDRTD